VTPLFAVPVTALLALPIVPCGAGLTGLLTGVFFAGVALGMGVEVLSAAAGGWLSFKVSDAGAGLLTGVFLTTGFFTAGEAVGVEVGAGAFLTIGFEVLDTAAGVLEGVDTGFLIGVDVAAVLAGVAVGVLVMGTAFLVPIGVRAGLTAGPEVESFGAGEAVFLATGLPDGLERVGGTAFLVPIGVLGFAAGDAVFFMFATPARFCGERDAIIECLVIYTYTAAQHSASSGLPVQTCWMFVIERNDYGMRKRRDVWEIEARAT
jgi:hypothetical protein